MRARELCDPIVDLAREAHNVGRDVVDAAAALDVVRVEEAEHVVGRVEDVGGVAMRRILRDERQRLRVHHAPRLDVEGDVEDSHFRFWILDFGFWINGGWESKIQNLKSKIGSREHHQAHARRRRRAGVLKLARAQELRVDFVAVDGFEAALAEVLLGRRRQQVELAQAARGEAVEELAHDAPAETAAAVFGIDGDRADERGELVRLGAATRNDAAAVACDDERAPVLVDARGRQRVRDEQRLDGGDVRRGRRSDRDVRHAARIAKRKGRAPRGLPVNDAGYSQWRLPPCEPLSPHVPLDLSLSLEMLLEPRADELPLFEPARFDDPLSIPLEPTLPLVRLLGSFSLFSDCPIFLPKSTEESLLL